jgi:hypothetical protein
MGAVSLVQSSASPPYMVPGSIARVTLQGSIAMKRLWLVIALGLLLVPQGCAMYGYGPGYG